MTKQDFIKVKVNSYIDISNDIFNDNEYIVGQVIDYYIGC